MRPAAAGDDLPDPDVCADPTCDHQRSAHRPDRVNPDGICLGCLGDADWTVRRVCDGFVEP